MFSFIDFEISFLIVKGDNWDLLELWTCLNRNHPIRLQVHAMCWIHQSYCWICRYFSAERMIEIWALQSSIYAMPFRFPLVSETGVISF